MPSPEAAQIQPARLKGLKALIVDDKEENLRYLEVLLGKHDYSVESARNGAEALAKAQVAAPDLVISDLLMPVMDGYTLLRHWKTEIVAAQVEMLSGKKKKDYAAESAANALETQAETLGMAPKSADDEDVAESAEAEEAVAELDATEDAEEGALVAA